MERGGPSIVSEAQATAIEPAEALGGASAPARARAPTIRRMLLSASVTVVLQGASLVMGFATAVLLARLLGREGYGRYVLGLTWATVLAIPAILGLDRFMLRGMSVYDVQGRLGLMRGLLRRTHQLVIAASAVVALAGCAVALWALDASSRWPLCVAMALVPLTTLTLLRQGAMQAIGRIVVGQVPEYVIRPLLTLAGIGALALAAPGALDATGALAISVLGATVAFAVGAGLLRRALPGELRAARPEYRTAEWLRAALPMMLISGVWMISNNCTTLLVGALAGARSAGVYSVIEKGAELIVVLLIAVNMPLAPQIARMRARGDRVGLQRASERIAQATLAASIPVALAFVLFPGVYLGVFGAHFRSGQTGLVILALAQVVNAAAGPAGNVLIMTGHERAAVRGIGTALLANILLAVALVPPFGVTGGAVAAAASLLLWNVIFFVLARRRVGVNVTAFRPLAVRTPRTEWS